MIIKNIQIQAPAKKLTPREVEILTLTAQGKVRPEIARVLKLSEETIKSYMMRACRKLNSVNKTHATAMAVALGLITPYRIISASRKK